MADGRSRVSGLAGGEDVGRTRTVLGELGVAVHDDAGASTVDGRGLDALVEPGSVLDCGNSGTTIRLLTGLLAGRPFLSVLSGDESLGANDPWPA